MERVADSNSINRQVIRKALYIMKRALYGWLILLAGEEEPHVWLLFLIGWWCSMALTGRNFPGRKKGKVRCFIVHPQVSMCPSY